jgi:LEA14-like dessication related protein
MLQRLLVLFLSLGFAACSSLPLDAIAPKVSVADVDVKSVSLFEQHFDVRLRLTNTNDFDLNIEALEFEFELNGRAFAKGLSNVPTRIPASASTVLRVDAMTQSTNLLQQIKILPETLKEGAPYRIKGRIKIDTLPVWLPFEHTGVVGGEAKKAGGSTI